MVIELVVPDFHGNMKIFKSLEKILAKHKVDRLFFVGDFSDGIDQSKIPQILKKNPQLGKYASKSGEVIARLRQKLQSGGRLSAEEEKELTHALKFNQQFGHILFSEEARLRYEPIDNAVKDISDKFKTSCYGVPGNHDNILCLKYLKALKPMLYFPKEISRQLGFDPQPLLKEKILGLVHIKSNGREMNPAFAGDPGRDETGELRYPFAFPDDDADELDKSAVWRDFKDTPLDLIVTHKSAMYGTTAVKDLAPHGKGLLELAKKNERLIEYAGHFHGDDIDGKGWIYNDDRNTGARSICPGTSFCMLVNRDGKKLKEVTPINLGYAAA